MDTTEEITMIMRLNILLFILFLSASVAASQESQSVDLRMKDAASSIYRSTSKLKWTSSSEALRYEQDKIKYTTELNEAIDKFVLGSSAEDAARINSNLAQLLREHRGNPEYTGPVCTQEGDFSYGRSIVIGYSLVRGGPAVNDSAVTIRGYRRVNDKMILSDTTGAEFDGYGIFIKLLPSPIVGELWFVALGPASGFNGSKNRLRIYAFDGRLFRTIWSPNDIMNASIDITSSGFSIKRLDEDQYYRLRSCPCFLQEDYVLMVSGPEQVGRRYLD